MATLTGAISIADLVDGQAGASIVGSNETHTFIATPEGMIDSTELSSFSNQYTVFVGTEQRTYQTGTGDPSTGSFKITATAVTPSGHDLTVVVSATGVITITDGAGGTGFADADTIDSVTITATIRVFIQPGSIAQYTKAITLTKAKGGNARVTRGVANKQTFEYARGATAPKVNTFANRLEIQGNFYSFTSTDASPIWTYIVDQGSAVTLSQTGATSVKVTTGTPGANEIGTYADSTAYATGVRIYHAADGEVYTVNTAVPASNTSPPGTNTSFTLSTATVGTIHETVANSVITVSLLRVTPRQYQQTIGSSGLRVAYTVARTVNSRAIGDTISVIKIEDALGAYNVNVLASGSTVFKNASGTVDVRAELELSGTRRPSTDITAWQWQKEGVNLVVSSVGQWSATTAYSVGNTVQFQTRLYTALQARGVTFSESDTFTNQSLNQQIYTLTPSDAGKNVLDVTAVTVDGVAVSNPSFVLSGTRNTTVTFTGLVVAAGNDVVITYSSENINPADDSLGWSPGNYVLQVTQPAATGVYHYLPAGTNEIGAANTNRWPAIRIGAADVTDDGADLFTCDLTFDEI